jgi:Raf kinase inhibitor-like YbhB/YbcL family protein
MNRLARGLCIPVFVVFALAIPRGEAEGADDMAIASPAFEHKGTIPVKHTCDGMDVSPPLVIENVPSDARSLAIIMDDPDAPGGTWVHWVVWNIPPETGKIREGSLPGGAKQGVNDFRKRSYGGPCPPSGVHRYFFRLYALKKKLDLGGSARKRDLLRAMEGHVLMEADLMGRYKRR